jgi:hypothetical protein
MSAVSIAFRSMARQKQHGRRAWQRIAAHLTAARKQGERGRSRVKIHLLRHTSSDPLPPMRPHLLIAHSAMNSLMSESLGEVNILMINHLGASLQHMGLLRRHFISKP